MAQRIENGRLLAVYLPSRELSLLTTCERGLPPFPGHEHYLSGSIDLYVDVEPWVLKQVVAFMRGEELQWSLEVFDQVFKFHQKYQIAGFKERIAKAELISPADQIAVDERLRKLNAIPDCTVSDDD